MINIYSQKFISEQDSYKKSYEDMILADIQRND